LGILSSSWMANRVNAAFQSRDGIVHFLAMLASGLNLPQINLNFQYEAA
jgi:hypothetical protein